jgi:hypothetical protein
MYARSWCLFEMLLDVSAVAAVRAAKVIECLDKHVLGATRFVRPLLIDMPDATHRRQLSTSTIGIDFCATFSHVGGHVRMISTTRADLPHFRQKKGN